MMFFLSKLWIWWFVAALVAGVVAAAVCHYWPARRRKPVVDERQVRALADVRAAAGKHEAKVNELLALRAKDLDELTTLRAKVDSVDTLSRRIKQLEAAQADAVVETPAPLPGAPAQTALLVGANDVVVDVSGASAVLRSRIKPDDLKVVEGIGPKIAQLLQAEGITTWRDLAATDAVTLRGILDAAGPRFQIHDPSTWPGQAELLANGEWAAFKALTEELKGGRVAR